MDAMLLPSSSDRLSSFCRSAASNCPDRSRSEPPGPSDPALGWSRAGPPTPRGNGRPGGGHQAVRGHRCSGDWHTVCSGMAHETPLRLHRRRPIAPDRGTGTRRGPRPAAISRHVAQEGGNEWPRRCLRRTCARRARLYSEAQREGARGSGPRELRPAHSKICKARARTGPRKVPLLLVRAAGEIGTHQSRPLAVRQNRKLWPMRRRAGFDTQDRRFLAGRQVKWYHQRGTRTPLLTPYSRNAE